MASAKLTQKQIDTLARDIARQVNDAERTLTMAFIPHERGRRDEALSLDEPSLLAHPAGVFIRHLLRNRAAEEGSAFYGLSIRTKKTFLGLLRKTSMLGLATLDNEEIRTPEEARHCLYHFAWHALDLAAVRQKPEYRGRFDNGPMIPRRKRIAQGKANLMADLFAATMAAFQGDRAAPRRIGTERAAQSLVARQGKDPGLFPYLLAVESADLSIAETLKGSVSKSRMIALARQVTAEVGATLDEGLLRQWHAFCTSAQDMAWRGYEPERILGAAIHGSEDPYVRSIGYLVAEATSLTPMGSADIKKGYNAFADPEINARAHREITEEIFAEAMAQGVYENSSSPFIEAANAQNRSLTEGRILGWCAAALQAAARAFDMALASNRPPGQAAHERFTTARNETGWETLEGLGEKIVDRRQKGHAVTLGGIAKLCESAEPLKSIADSVSLSLKDPAFAARLEAANALTHTPPMPAAPAPAGPRPSAPPAPVAIPAGPALGGAPIRAVQKPRSAAAAGRPPSTRTQAQNQESDSGNA